MRIGVIQSAGLGDIVIALPIARYYADQGHEIHWPILAEYLPHFAPVVPWVHWHGVARDSIGDHFFRTPQAILSGTTERTLCLYHHLSAEPDFSPQTTPAAVLKFDQYKYAVAKVPFAEKWNLSRCLTRNLQREQALFDRLVKNDRYLAVHRKGADEIRHFDASAALRRGYDLVEVEELSDCLFDWLTILERASILALVDSVFSNLVDQLGIGANASKLFLCRSHRQIAWTPVMLGHWEYI